MRREKTLIKNTILYAITNFIPKILSFVMLPLYSYYISIDDYGKFDMIFATISILLPIVTMQINEGLYRFLMDAKTEKETSSIISTAIYINFRNILIFCILGSSTLYVFHFQYGFYTGFLLIASIVLNLGQQIARGLKENVIYSISGVLNTFLIVFFNLIFIILLKMKIEALFLSLLCASIFTIIYLERKLRIHRFINFQDCDKKLSREIITYSVPLLLNSINWWIMNLADRYIIGSFLGVSANGTYAVANKLPTILMMLNSIFYLSWQDTSINEHNSIDKDKFYTKMLNLYIKLQFSALIVLLGCTKFILKIMLDKTYFNSWKYIPLLYYGAIFLGLSSFYGVAYITSKNTKGTFTTSLYGALVQIITVIFLISKLGIQAASLATMLSFLTMWITRIYQTREVFKVKIHSKSFSLLIIISVIYTFLYYYDNQIVDILKFIISLVIALLANKELINNIVKLAIEKTEIKLKLNGNLEVNK